MDYAIIDLGSNSIRLSVYECEGDRILKTFSVKEIAGLAEYISKDILSMEGILKACAVLNDFKETACRFAGASNTCLFATAALRNIKNREDAVRIITEKTSLAPDVLEGCEEAALGFAGVSRFVSCESGVMIDIGGASTEIVLFREYKPEKLVSIPIGCLNLSKEYVNGIIPTAEERKKIKAITRKHLSKIDWGNDVKCPLMIGTGGTMRAVLKLAQTFSGATAEQQGLKSSQVKEISKLLQDNAGQIYHTVYKTIPERLLTISTGLVILQQAIRKFGCETISVSKYGIREGYLIGRVIKVNDGHDSNQ